MDNTAQNNQVNNQQAQTADQNQSTQSIQQASGPNLDDKIVLDNNQFTPASSLNKERMPGGTFSEIVKPSESEVKVSEQLQNVGVVAASDKPNLDEIHEQIGVKHSLENVPVPSVPSSNVVLPMSEKEADVVLSNKQSKFNLHENVGEFAGEYTEDSLPFFAALIKKVFKEMHRRVFKNK